DLTISDLSIGYLDYGSSYHGNAIRLMWNKDGEVGELRISHEGNYIETFEFADGTTVSNITGGDTANDVLTSSGEDEGLFGGAGSDRFVFADNAGQDVIADFEDGLDVIDLEGVSTINSFADVQDAANQIGDNVEIDLENGSTLTINNINVDSQLDQSDFHFA
ncbi:MAG: hypothetical protein AAF352_07415, partial [Pseudomonadota bacterium]